MIASQESICYNIIILYAWFMIWEMDTRGEYRFSKSTLSGTRDVADFEIGATTTFTREHPLAPGGKACVITNAL
jgi:hypothetical protein